MSFRPCDHRWVAAEIVDLALAPALSSYQRAADLGGLERVSLADAAALLRAEEGKPTPRPIAFPPLGDTLRAYEGAANLPDPDAKIGGSSLREVSVLITWDSRCRKRTYTFASDAIHTLQHVRSARNARARAFLTL
jgi:hypothetical protein